MKCTLNDTEIFELSESQVNVLKHCISADKLEETIKALMIYVVKHKLSECAGKLFNEWKPKLIAEGVQQIPILDSEFVDLICARPDYEVRLEQ